MTTNLESGAFGPILPRHIGMLLLLAMVWGTSFLVIKIGVEYMSAIQLTAFRLSVAAFVMIVCALIMRSEFPTGVRAWTYCFALAAFGNSFPFFLISWGEEAIASGLAAILMAVMPLTTLVLAHYFTDGDRLRPQKLIGILLGFGGVIVLVGPEALKGLGGDFIRQLATAGGAVCYAISVIIVRRMPPSPMMGRAALVLGFSVLQTVPLALYLSGWTLPELTFDSIWPSVYLGVFPTALATLILFKLLSEREPSFVAFQNYLVPVFGIMWGALLLDEVVTMQAMAALLLILCGIYVANRRRRQP